MQEHQHALLGVAPQYDMIRAGQQQPCRALPRHGESGQRLAGCLMCVCAALVVVYRSPTRHQRCGQPVHCSHMAGLQAAETLVACEHAYLSVIRSNGEAQSSAPEGRQAVRQPHSYRGLGLWVVSRGVTGSTVLGVQLLRVDTQVLWLHVHTSSAPCVRPPGDHIANTMQVSYVRMGTLGIPSRVRRRRQQIQVTFSMITRDITLCCTMRSARIDTGSGVDVPVSRALVVAM